MRRKYLKLSDENELINLTPLLDVLFVVLILFILIAPMMNIEKINLTQSASKTLETSSMNEKNTLPITINKHGIMSISNKEIDMQTLKVVLYKIHQSQPSLKPRLFIDKMAPFGRYTKIKDLMEEIGFYSLEIALKSESS